MTNGAMDRTMSAAKANRSFSRLLREVREGTSYVVTVHGKPVARITPCNAADATRAAAQAALFKRLRSQPIHDVGHWTRDELHER